jgi:hypothetical protein
MSNIIVDSLKGWKEKSLWKLLCSELLANTICCILYVACEIEWWSRSKSRSCVRCYIVARIFSNKAYNFTTSCLLKYVPCTLVNRRTHLAWWVQMNLQVDLDVWFTECDACMSSSDVLARASIHTIGFARAWGMLLFIYTLHCSDNTHIHKLRAPATTLMPLLNTLSAPALIRPRPANRESITAAAHAAAGNRLILKFLAFLFSCSSSTRASTILSLACSLSLHSHRN